jgi:hypothetical protein
MKPKLSPDPIDWSRCPLAKLFPRDKLAREKKRGGVKPGQAERFGRRVAA